jgi:hypothetical protein
MHRRLERKNASTQKINNAITKKIQKVRDGIYFRRPSQIRCIRGTGRLHAAATTHPLRIEAIHAFETRPRGTLDLADYGGRVARHPAVYRDLETVLARAVSDRGRLQPKRATELFCTVGEHKSCDSPSSDPKIAQFRSRMPPVPILYKMGTIVANKKVALSPIGRKEYEKVDKDAVSTIIGFICYFRCMNILLECTFYEFSCI